LRTLDLTSVHLVAIARARFPTPAAVVRALASELEARGAVRASFADAVLQREATSPTGLPMPGGPVALPHADPEHVLAASVGVATLAEPVPFAQMGSPAERLAVRTVLLLALPSREHAQAMLVRLVRSLQNPDAVARLHAAADESVLADAVKELWKS
jgi:PTS system galactitol-specific IIA component